MPLFSYPRLLGCGGATLDAHAPSGQETDSQAEVLAFFGQLGHRLLCYAASFALPLQDAEDVVQEAFLALNRHLIQGRSRENLPEWLYRTTHHLALKKRTAPHTSFVSFCRPTRTLHTGEQVDRTPVVCAELRHAWHLGKAAN